MQLIFILSIYVEYKISLCLLEYNIMYCNIYIYTNIKKYTKLQIIYHLCINIYIGYKIAIYKIFISIFLSTYIIYVL